MKNKNLTGKGLQNTIKEGQDILKEIGKIFQKKNKTAKNKGRNAEPTTIDTTEEEDTTTVEDTTTPTTEEQAAATTLFGRFDDEEYEDDTEEDNIPSEEELELF